jgi:DNA-damage-inducible protein J
MVNAKSNVNVKINKNIKTQAVDLLSRMGIDQTTAIEMFYRKIIVERRLPFQPEPLLTPGEKLFKVLQNKNMEIVELESDGKGNIIIDKEKTPELYDWGVNG